MISTPDRQNAVELIDEARESGARLWPACRVLGITARTYQRWTADGGVRTDRRQRLRARCHLTRSGLKSVKRL